MRRAEHADGREKCRIQIKTKKGDGAMEKTVKIRCGTLMTGSMPRCVLRVWNARF